MKKTYNDELYEHMKNLTTAIALILIAMDGIADRKTKGGSQDAIGKLIDKSIELLDRPEDISPRLYAQMTRLSDTLADVYNKHPGLIADCPAGLFEESSNIRDTWRKINA